MSLKRTLSSELENYDDQPELSDSHLPPAIPIDDPEDPYITPVQSSVGPEGSNTVAIIPSHLSAFTVRIKTEGKNADDIELSIHTPAFHPVQAPFPGPVLNAGENQVSPAESEGSATVKHAGNAEQNKKSSITSCPEDNDEQQTPLNRNSFFQPVPQRTPQPRKSNGRFARKPKRSKTSPAVTAASPAVTSASPAGTTTSPAAAASSSSASVNPPAAAASSSSASVNPPAAAASSSPASVLVPGRNRTKRAQPWNQLGQQPGYSIQVFDLVPPSRTKGP